MFKYYLRNNLRSKTFLFWCLCFPLALMLCFKIAFGNLTTVDSIITLDTAVIYTGENAQYEESFQTMMDSLTEGEEPLFKVHEYSSEDAVTKALIKGDIDLAFKVTDGNVEVLLSNSYTDTACAVGRAVADTYMNNYTLIEDAFAKNPKEAMALIDSLGEEIDVLVPAPSNFVDESPNPYIWYFYSSFVMGMLFNSMNGVNMVYDIKADVSSAAMRVSVSPSKKSRMIIACFMSKLVVALVINVTQLFIMKNIFEVPLGNNYFKLGLFVVACNVFAIAFGEVCGSLMKGTLDNRENKVTAIIMTSVFLSGEMIASLPGFLELNCPIINDINPATVMNMAFYRLAYSTKDFDFYTNMAKIIITAIALLAISIVILRREKYASV